VRHRPSEDEKVVQTELTKGGGWQRCFTRFWYGGGSPAIGDRGDAKGKHEGCRVALWRRRIGHGEENLGSVAVGAS
jgi:hypothetical protein